MKMRTLATYLVLSSVGASSAPAGPCEPGWTPGLFAFGSINGPVRASAVIDFGSGPVLYLGHDTGTGISRWDGTGWPGLPNMSAPVLALLPYDDGNGPALYAGGDFNLIQGGITLGRVGKWDGKTWSPLANGFTDTVRALATFDDGNGTTLYAGGDFFQAQVEGIHSIARWDGAQWVPLNTGLEVFNDLNGAAHALAVFDDGNGAALYAAGEFTLASGVTVNRVARWDGSQWSALGSGVDGTVSALMVHDGALYAGGSFSTAGGQPAANVARWDGIAWSALDAGTNGPVRALGSLRSCGSPGLWAGGEFTLAGGSAANYIAVWDGANWSQPGPGLANGSATVDGVFTLACYNGSIHAAGDFALAVPNASPTQDVARWDGAAWKPLSQGINGNSVEALHVFDDGGGADLYVGGEFFIAANIVANHIARWDGAAWSAVGPGFTGQVNALTTYNNSLYAAGAFSTVVGGLTVNGIARWNGNSWVSVGGGLIGSTIRDLAVFGGQLYAVGDFQGHVVPGNFIARWNGAVWSSVGGSLSGPASALVVYDDGTGAALYVGGAFTSAGGVSANRIAMWDGTNWTALGSGIGGGLDPGVHALAGFDEGNGPRLYAGGIFTQAGGVPAANIAKWDGQGWLPVGGGTNNVVLSLRPFDDASGPALYAGGDFTMAGNQPLAHIARWDGELWTGLSTGMNFDVRALAEFDDSAGARLYAGGAFDLAGDLSSWKLARWVGCPPLPCPWDMDQSGAVGITDFLTLLSLWGTDPGGPPDFNGDGDVGIGDFLELLGNWGACP